MLPSNIQPLLFLLTVLYTLNVWYYSQDFASNCMNKALKMRCGNFFFFNNSYFYYNRA